MPVSLTGPTPEPRSPTPAPPARTQAGGSGKEGKKSGQEGRKLVCVILMTVDLVKIHGQRRGEDSGDNQESGSSPTMGRGGIVRHSGARLGVRPKFQCAARWPPH